MGRIPCDTVPRFLNRPRQILGSRAAATRGAGARSADPSSRRRGHAGAGSSRNPLISLGLAQRSALTHGPGPARHSQTLVIANEIGPYGPPWWPFATYLQCDARYLYWPQDKDLGRPYIPSH